MYCPNCGAPLEEQGKFCPRCGAAVQQQPPAPLSPTPEKEKKKSSPVPLMVLLCLVFCLLGAGGTYLLLGGGGAEQTPPSSSQEDSSREEPGQEEDESPAEEEEETPPSSSQSWEDPDQLVKAYHPAQKQGDVDGVLALCDIPEQLEYLDWEADLERYLVIGPTMYLPAGDDTTARLAREKLEGEVTDRLLSVWSGPFAGRSEIAAAVVSGRAAAYDRGSGEGAEFLRLFSQENFGQIQWAACLSDLSQRENTVSMAIGNVKEVYSGQVTDYREYLVLSAFDGSYSVHGLTLYRYGDFWKIHSLAAPLTGLPANGEYLSQLEGMTPEQAQQEAAEEYGILPEQILYP